MKVTRCSIDPDNAPRSERPGIRIELSIQEAQLIESAIVMAQLREVPETFVRQLVELRIQINRALNSEVSASAMAAGDRETQDHNTRALEKELEIARSKIAYYQCALQNSIASLDSAIHGIDQYLRTREHE
jgi:hypothetical protein